MYQRLKVNRVLGEGSYAKVYECEAPTLVSAEDNDDFPSDGPAGPDGNNAGVVDQTKKKCAVKRIEMESNGLPCIIELSILQSFVHPYLMKSYAIQMSKRSVSIILPLANSDLRQKTYRKITPLSYIKRWMYQVGVAIRLLHSQRIVHGDIKAGNIMLESPSSSAPSGPSGPSGGSSSADCSPNGQSSSLPMDNVNVSLADFSLATCIFGEIPRHMVCTCTHRPLEVWKNYRWSFPVDIFSFGCTLYESAFGRNLFPYQGVSADQGETVQVTTKSIKCLEKFYKQLETVGYIASEPSSTPPINFTIDPTSSPSSTPTAAADANFKPAVLNDLLFPLQDDTTDDANDYRLLTSLILRCVARDPQQRPAIEEVLSDRFSTAFVRPLISIETNTK